MVLAYVALRQERKLGDLDDDADTTISTALIVTWSLSSIHLAKGGLTCAFSNYK